MIRRFAFLVFAWTLLAACAKDEGPGYTPPAVADRTVLLYMPGRDLEVRGKYFSKNITSVREAVAKQALGNGRMLVCWQPDSQTSAVIQEVYYDKNKRRSETITLKTYDDFRAGNPEKVRQLFADATELAPARSYGLIIGCHGKAWIPASRGAMSPYALRPGQRREEDIWTPAPGALVTRSFGDSGYELDIPELAAALEAQRFRFDYLIFDACFMASIEAIYDLREVVDYYVASPCEIMGAGFPYARTLPYLFANKGAEYDLQRVCEEFYRFYNDDWDSVPKNAQSGCISMAVMSQIDALAEVMRRINEHGTRPFEPSELQYYEGMRTHLFYDLGHYVELTCDDAALREDFAAQFDKAFPPACRLHTTSFYSEYNHQMNPVTFYSGVCTSEPSTKYTADNKQTGWYLKTHGGL